MKPNDNAPVVEPGRCSQLERISRWLLQHAARTAPAALSERLEEEWLAHLEAQRGALRRLSFAIGCCWARRVIAHDYLAAVSAAPARGHGTIVFGQHDPYYLSRRTTILLLIVALHAAVIYGFATGFAQKVLDAIPGPMQISLLNTPEMRVPLPPPIVSHLRTPAFIVPRIPPTVEFTAAPPLDSLTPQASPAIAPVAPPKQVRRVLGGPGPTFPNTDDFYPLPARRLGEMGVATVRVCIDARGHLASTPMIAQSSGWARLDAAALQLARAGSGHYRSTTEDGVAVNACYPFRIRFQLKQ